MIAITKGQNGRYIYMFSECMAVLGRRGFPCANVASETSEVIEVTEVATKRSD